MVTLLYTQLNRIFFYIMDRDLYLFYYCQHNEMNYIELMQQKSQNVQISILPKNKDGIKQKKRK